MKKNSFEGFHFEDNIAHAFGHTVAELLNDSF